MNQPKPSIVGRASAENPPNRYERIHLETELVADRVEGTQEDPHRKVPTEFFDDAARSIIRENDSPDIPFRYSINPYRGCEHGCAYCYARTGHETLGWGAGLDFETKILVKRNAADLLRHELGRPKWRGEVIAISGYTDCYQPAERELRVTRSCLEVLHEANQAIGIVTKNGLVTRDIELLASMAEKQLVHVNITVTSLDQELTRTMEPRTASPQARLRAMRTLVDAGVPVRVMVAPVIPGLTDHEMPNILRESRDAGATGASYQMLRLPLSVEPVFLEWVRQNYPQYYDRIENRIRQLHGGQIYRGQFGQRMRGSGALAESIHATFHAFAKKFGLDNQLTLDTSRFRPPVDVTGQQYLF